MKAKFAIRLPNLAFIFKDVYFLLTIAVYLLLVVYKLPDFSLPYFSDELWVYGPSVRKMGIFGPSILPNSLGIEDHWGHPMFFFFSGGLWCYIFGASILSTHIFSALLSLILLITIYLTGKEFFNREVGFYSMLIFASQSIFHGQFLLVLPEILLTILALLTIYFHFRGKYWQYLIVACCLVLTKETGVFPILAIVIWELIKTVGYDRTEFSLKKVIINNLKISLPLIALALHFLLLKYFYDWFIMPVRVDAFKFNWEVFHERIMHSFHYVFVGQGRRPIIITLFVVAILFKKSYPIWKRIGILLISFSLVKVFFKYWELPNVFEMFIVPILFIIIIKFVLWDVYKSSKKEGNIIGVFSIFILTYIVFSSSQFDSLRYLLCIIPIFILLTLYFVSNVLTLKKYLLPIVSVVFISFSGYYIVNDENYGDDTNNYSKMIIARKKAVDYLQSNNYHSYNIEASFLFKHAIERPLSGYVSNVNKFKNCTPLNLDFNNDSKTVYILESTDHKDFVSTFKQSAKFDIEKRYEVDSAWVEILIKN